MPIYKLGLVGYPLAHSFSPLLHQAALDSLGLEGEYNLYPLEKNRKGDLSLGGLVEMLRYGKLQGLNVTIPHKQAVLPYIDRLGESAERTGAVNTLHLARGEVVGVNTDYGGFKDDLVQHLQTPAKCVVLGAGGGARAVIAALLDLGCTVVISARSERQAERVKTDLGMKIPSGRELMSCIPLDGEQLAQVILQSDALINTTPVGMFPNLDENPLPGGLELPGGMFVYDLVYNPLETKLIQESRRKGASTASGLGMLLRQAALAFEIWTGYSPTLAVMLKAVEAHLAGN